MSLGEMFFIGWSLLMVVICIVFFVWAWESGQFKNIEKSKFTMLEDKEPLSWPDHEKVSNKKNTSGRQGGGV